MAVLSKGGRLRLYRCHAPGWQGLRGAARSRIAALLFLAQK